MAMVGEAGRCRLLPVASADPGYTQRISLGNSPVHILPVLWQIICSNWNPNERNSETEEWKAADNRLINCFVLFCSARFRVRVSFLLFSLFCLSFFSISFCVCFVPCVLYRMFCCSPAIRPHHHHLQSQWNGASQHRCQLHVHHQLCGTATRSSEVGQGRWR